MAAGKNCQISSPVVYSLSQAGVIQKEDECIFPSPDCLDSLFSPHRNNDWLISLRQISDVVVAWWVYENRIRKMESHTSISIQGNTTLAKAEAAQFTGVNVFVFKLPFWFFWFNNATLTDCLPTRVLLLQEWDIDSRCQNIGEALLYIRWCQSWLNFKLSWED